MDPTNIVLPVVPEQTTNPPGGVVVPPTLPATPHKPSGFNMGGVLTLGVGLVGLFAIFFTTQSALRPSQQALRAADPTIKSVAINPGKIITQPGGAPIFMSALAYDSNNQPIWSNVNYVWGISSTNVVGTVTPNLANSAITKFQPLSAGTGDLFVTASNSLSRATGYALLTIGTSPLTTPSATPMASPSATTKPTPTPHGKPIITRPVLPPVQFCKPTCSTGFICQSGKCIPVGPNR